MTYAEAVRLFRRAIVRHALEESQGCVKDAATALDLTRPYLHRLCQELGINPADYRPASGVLRRTPE